MSMHFVVALLSGRSVEIDVDHDISLEALKQKAQQALGVWRCRLLSPKGTALAGPQTVEEAGLRTQDILQAQIGQTRIATSRQCDPRFEKHAALAAVLGDGCVSTWGYSRHGGDIERAHVDKQLMDVEQIQSSEAAFAAILRDGSVVTWGHPRCGGDSSAAQSALRNVQQIQTSLS